jgi:formamidopyrimidine-DNA glycosylase
MPELPEVNTFQRYFDGCAPGRKITEVQVHDDKIMRNCSGHEFAEKLQGRVFTGSYRRGKYLFGSLDNGHHVLLHFGMTGDLKYYSEPEDKPKHERFAFVFDNGFRLGFDDPRKFARILYLEDLEAYIRSLPLGEDALLISEAEFLGLLEKNKGQLKAFLLNQKLLAGVGNLYADEICYQARIHPASNIQKLKSKDKKLLFELMRSILNRAIERHAYYKEYPEDWFWQWRVEGHKGPDGKGKVLKADIAGRTTYWCEPWQKLIV